MTCVRLLSRPLAVLGTLCILLLSPRPAAADPFRVTGGTATVTGGIVTTNTALAISGDDFRIDVVSSSGGSRVLTETVLFPGTPYSLNSGMVAPFGGSLTFEGVTHPISGGTFGPSIGNLLFETPSFQLPTGQQFVDVSVPFSMTGFLGFSNSPTDRVVLELFGSGTAFARASAVTFSGHTGYEIRQLDFVFGVTPTPEPATVLLVGFSLAIAARRRFAGTGAKST
jgi:hypothetical protein